MARVYFVLLKKRICLTKVMGGGIIISNKTKFLWRIFMKKLFVVCALAGLIVLAGCTSISPVTATSNPVGSKVGEASGSYLFSIFPMSGADYSIKAAAENGGITTISTVDIKRTDYFGFWATYTTIVTGE